MGQSADEAWGALDKWKSSTSDRYFIEWRKAVEATAREIAREEVEKAKGAVYRDVAARARLDMLEARVQQLEDEDLQAEQEREGGRPQVTEAAVEAGVDAMVRRYRTDPPGGNMRHEFGVLVREEFLPHMIPDSGEQDAPAPADRELLCQMCGRDYPLWSADNDLWNEVMREDGKDEYAFVCPTCFMLRAVFSGVRTTFFVSREEPDAPAPSEPTKDELPPEGITPGQEAWVPSLYDGIETALVREDDGSTYYLARWAGGFQMEMAGNSRDDAVRELIQVTPLMMGDLLSATSLARSYGKSPDPAPSEDETTHGPVPGCRCSFCRSAPSEGEEGEVSPVARHWVLDPSGTGDLDRYIRQPLYSHETVQRLQRRVNEIEKMYRNRDGRLEEAKAEIALLRDPGNWRVRYKGPFGRANSLLDHQTYRPEYTGPDAHDSPPESEGESDED